MTTRGHEPGQRPPSVDALARSLAGSGLPHPLLVDAARAAIVAGRPETAAAEVERRRAGLLQPVINATGVLLHTNLGRAPLAVDQSHEDLTANTWDLMRFKEVDLDNGDLAWLIRKDSCMHCDEPGYLLACPAPGAVVQYENGIVDFDQTKCIGCQYCISGCPFDIPRFDRTTEKVYKCTMCVDRIGAGLEPACVKACPTGSIRFGSKAEMVAYGVTKVEKLHERGFDDALLYDPSGVNGLHMMYVVPRGDMLGDYGLPEDPEVRSTFSFIGALKALRGLGAVGIWAGLIGAAVYWLRTGRTSPPPQDEALAVAEGLGRPSRREGRSGGIRRDPRPG